ncbi:MAG: NAD(P)-dependent oxidoreductase, partial [Clostridia bacterium]|nr:NAD(P)-dependent oxidoreductase [Clostridia bacterium]
MNKIGMVGLGVMGHGIARNIMNGGFDMVLYDLRPEAFADLVEDGAQAAESLAQLGEMTDTVLMIVNSYTHCCNVMSGLLETMRGGTIINMSTIAVDDAKKLSEMAAEKGVSMMDCPVSGGTAGAKAGTLTVMAGGSDDLFEKYKPLFESFGKNVIHVGKEIGHGQAIKAVNQLLVGVHMCATAEAFTMARKCGLDLKLVYDTICTSAGSSRIFESRGQFLIDRDFSTRSTLQIQLKDTDIACKAADAV